MGGTSTEHSAATGTTNQAGDAGAPGDSGSSAASTGGGGQTSTLTTNTNSSITRGEAGGDGGSDSGGEGGADGGSESPTSASQTTTMGGVGAVTSASTVVTSTSSTTVTSTTVGGTTASATITTGATTATTGGGSGCDAPPADGTAPMIDDFEDRDHTILSNEGRFGHWYQYGDTEGTQTTTPIEGAPSVDGALHSTGSGFTDYGAGVSVDLNYDNATGNPCEYDASFYTGVQFQITTDAPLKFKIALEATTGDSGHYEFAIAAADSGLVQVPFAMLAQPTWADSADWDPAKILQLQWYAAAEVDFTFTLDNVSFY